MSRIIVQNLPKNINDELLHKHFSESGSVTDTKLIHKDGVFRRFGFVGFESQDQAMAACKNFNNTYLGSSKITVEIAKDLHDASRPKGRQAIKEEEKDGEKKKKDAIKFRKQMAELRMVEDNKKERNSLLMKYIKDPKFIQLLELNGGATKNGLSTEEWKKIEKKTSVESDDDEGIELEDKPARDENLSDKDYLKSLMVQEDEEEEKSQKPKNWKELFTLRLCMYSFPKTSINIKKGDKETKKRGVNKKMVKDFFKPLKCSSIRRKTNEGKFEYYVGFASEKVYKEALLKDRSYLGGVRVKISKVGKEKNDSTDVVRGKGAAKWSDAAEKLEKAESVADSGRVFVRNLYYHVTEDILKEKFEPYGTIAEIDLPICKLTGKAKGFAVVTFQDPKNAVEAMNALDGSVMSGRVVHILPCLPDEVRSWKFAPEIKAKKHEEKKVLDESSWQNWNTLFISNAVVTDLLAKKHNVTKEEMMTLEGSDLATTLALAETEYVNQIKDFLVENGVSVEAFINPKIERSNTVLLVKDLPVETKASDIAELFGKYGDLGRVVMPPLGVTCIVEFINPSEAKTAKKKLAYRRFGSVPLYIEKAPVGTFNEEYKKPKEKAKLASKETAEKKTLEEENEVVEGEDNLNEEEERIPEDHTTVYVENLPKEISEEAIHEHFSKAGEVYKVVVAKKGNQSRGYGFVQYYSQKNARNALVKLENSTLEDKNISLKLSEKKFNVVPNTSRKIHNFGVQKGSKIVVKNIPFQATRNEVQNLFKAFGSLKRVHLQKHQSGHFNNGGYGFVEFVQNSDAKRALEMMGLSTHLQGRRLVLEWAKEDETLDELREKTAQKRSIVETYTNQSNKKMRHAIREMDTTEDFDEDY